MQPSMYQSPKAAIHTLTPKPQTSPLVHHFTAYSPVAPRSVASTRHAEDHHIGINNKNIYGAEQGKYQRLENVIKNSTVRPQRNIDRNGDASFPRYGDMKSSYMGPDSREVVYTREPAYEPLKNIKRMPRASEPNLFPEPSFKQNADLINQMPVNRKKASEEVKMYLPTASSSTKTIEPEERRMMRKSSFDPTADGWLKKSSPLLRKKAQKRFNLEDFQKISELGVGKYGKVFLVREKTTSFICALKVIEKQMLRQQQITEQFIRQLKIQTFLNHPHITKMYGYFDDTHNIYIILEVALGGQLYKQLKTGVGMPEAKVATIMRQVVSAVGELHANHIIHRDIKPENIVLNEGLVKVCDFGWSVFHGQSLRSTFCGTPLYVSPQILKGVSYDEKIDIWSIGIMMYEMLVGHNPFKITQEEELIKIIKDSVVFPGYCSVSEEARSFVFSCLKKNPAERANIRELSNHQFFKKYPEKGQGAKMPV